MAIQWRSIGSNGDGRNGANGAPHRHWHQWRSPLDPVAITIGDQWRHLNGSIGDEQVEMSIERGCHQW